MKRGNKVVNAAAVKAGRSMARWAASGMNWAEGAHKAAVMAAGRQILAGGAVAADQVGRMFLVAEASDSSGSYPAACWWQTPASEIILAWAAA